MTDFSTESYFCLQQVRKCYVQTVPEAMQKQERTETTQDG